MINTFLELLVEYKEKHKLYSKTEKTISNVQKLCWYKDSAEPFICLLFCLYF